MTVFAALGYQFALAGQSRPPGSVVLCQAVPIHGLTRRRLAKYPHMSRLLFDPQLYLANLQVHRAAKICARLGSYPWFGIAQQLGHYDSGQQKQHAWAATAKQRIASLWPGSAPTDPFVIDDAVRQCVDLQIRLNCEAIILPAPLVFDPASSCAQELVWLDKGLTYARSVTKLPVYATVAIADSCLRYIEPEQNELINLLADSISARGVDGIYLVIEQGSEAADARQCNSARVLSSVLHITHLFAQDCGLGVVVNFLGAFGLACTAAGATIWSTGWYKSLHRLRLADIGADGRAYPMFWSGPAAADINLDTDFDALVASGMLAAIADQTSASQGLLTAAATGVPVRSVPAWVWQQGHIQAASEHFLDSVIRADAVWTALPLAARVAQVDAWLANATATASNIAARLGNNSKTRTNHVPAWLDAFRSYRRIHNV